MAGAQRTTAIDTRPTPQANTTSLERGPTGSAILTLTREGAGIELRRGRFEIWVDDQRVGALEPHETVEIPVEPAHHTLRIRAGRYSSHDRSFDVAEGEVVSFRVHGAMLWPRYVVSMVKPDLAISLTGPALRGTDGLTDWNAVPALPPPRRTGYAGW